MKKEIVSNIYNLYDIQNNIVNRNSIKCLLKAMNKKGLSKIEGQYYIYDEETFIHLINIYKKLNKYFNFYYSLKSDLISMFLYLISSIFENQPIIFNAFFCPGYNDKGGYKNYLGNTTIKKLYILNQISNLLTDEGISFQIICYYCDSYIENCDTSLNPNWLEELKYNRQLFHIEGEKYFVKENIRNTSDMEIFKNEVSYAGHIDNEIINSIPIKVYKSFYIANKVFYQKLNFSEEKIKERNDILVTMYIKVSNYVNGIQNGIYLPMENMYDREKIISNNNTCTMYLNQEMMKNYE